MASFRRKGCKDCQGIGRRDGETGPCATCNGAGEFILPIKVSVKVRIDNRAPADFIMAIYPNGRLGFRKKGTRTEIFTTVTGAFNKARLESAAQERPTKRRRRVSRGLLSIGK